MQTKNPMRFVIAAVVLLMPATGVAQTPPPTQGAVSGEAVYKARCAQCHEQASGRVQPRTAIQNMTSVRILRTLDFGAMMTVAYPMLRDEREAVANFLGKHEPEPGPRPEAFCRDRSVKLGDLKKGTWNGWSPTADNSRFVPADVARLTAAQVPTLTLKWAFGFQGDISAFGQPTVIGNREYDTVNGLKAKGGAIDGPGAIVVNGMVLVNSGYTRQGGIAGNVLLAFAPEN